MDTNRISLKICIASLALCATAVSAQTIYKQVDTDGLVTFTDRPSSQARVVASYETSRPSRSQDDEAAAEPVRARTTLEERGSVAQSTPSAPEFRPQAESRTFTQIRTAQGFRDNATDGPAAAAPKAVPRNEVERAIATYSPLASALAMKKDATESARRARQEAQKATPTGVLIVKPAAREHEPVPAHERISWFYVLWATTFFILAAGLLYVGFQTLRLILRGVFPRWELGLG